MSVFSCVRGYRDVRNFQLGQNGQPLPPSPSFPLIPTWLRAHFFSSFSSACKRTVNNLPSNTSLKFAFKVRVYSSIFNLSNISTPSLPNSPLHHYLFLPSLWLQGFSQTFLFSCNTGKRSFPLRRSTENVEKLLNFTS